MSCIYIAAPARPSSVAGKVLSSSQINITWNKPAEWNGVPAKYMVEFAKIGTDGSFQSKDNILPSQLYQNISNLVAYTEYKFRVILINGHNFFFRHSITIRITFSESCYHYLPIDILFVWFHRGSKFPIAFSNDVIVTS